MSQSQDQSEFFRGTANVGTTFKDSKSVDGSSKKAIPAFVFGEELADLADHPTSQNVTQIVSSIRELLKKT
jgi:hypothetical protein